jgi:Major Facilitator Superfamily/Cyclic nucleotide-binding domain
VTPAALDPGAMSRIITPFQALGDVLRNPELGRLQVAWAGVSLSMWAFMITIGVYAFDVGGAAAVGVAGLVRMLPGAFASPFAGFLGDRHSRRAVLLWSTLGTAVVLASAAAAVAAGSPAWVVFALAGFYTVVNSPYVPTEAALMPQLARTPQELSAANVTHSAMDNLGFLVGSILSGVLLALTSVQLVFLLAAATTAASCIALAAMSRDRRPEYTDGADDGGVVRQTTAGFRALIGDPSLRLVSAALTVLLFVEGAADVLIVIIALDLLGLSDSSVGYMNAAWGIGALFAGAGLAVLLDRGQLASGLVAGSLVTGAAIALPGIWPVVLAAYVTWFAVGIGYTLIEVAGNTLLQRLGDDEVLARARGSLETARLAAMALGSITVTGLVELFGVRGAVLAVGAVLPTFALLRWRRLRSLEAGAPVSERHFSLLRADPIFAPLPLATLERLTHDLVEVEMGGGDEVITAGEVGDRFYLIESGEVEVLQAGVHRCNQAVGESFGEIALLRDEPRTATVRTLIPSTLLVLDRDRFLAAITGHVRASEAADSVIDRRLGAPG